MRAGQRDKATVFEIAAAAGVSIATVDRVLNRRKGVKKATAERVMAAAADLDYRPDIVAQSLSRRDDLRFDILLPSGTNSFIRWMAELVDRVAGEVRPFRVVPRAVLTEALDAPALAAALRRLKGRSQGVAVIALDHPAVREAVDELAAAGVPVVTLVSDLAGSRRHGYVGVDNRAAGRTAGLLMGRFLRGSRGTVALIPGSYAYLGHREREQGFRAVLAERFPGLAVIAGPESQEDSVLGYRSTRALLDRAGGDLLGLYILGGGVRGVARAVEEAGRHREVTLIGHELLEHTRDLLARDVLDAAISQNPHQQITSAVRMLLDLRARRGEDGPPRVELTRIEIFTRENLP